MSRDVALHIQGNLTRVRYIGFGSIRLQSRRSARTATKFYTTAEMSGLFFLAAKIWKSVKICVEKRDLLAPRQNGTTTEISILTGEGWRNGAKLSREAELKHRKTTLSRIVVRILLAVGSRDGENFDESRIKTVQYLGC